VTTFAQWLADPTLDRIVLAEVQPCEELGGFTRDTTPFLPTRVATSGATMVNTGVVGTIGLQTYDANATDFESSYPDSILIARIVSQSTGAITAVSVTFTDNATGLPTTYAMTKAAGAASGNFRADIWYLLTPAPALAVPSYSITMTGVTLVSSFWELWTRVNQSTPFGTAVTNTVANTTPSVTVTAATHHEVIDVLYAASDAITGTIGAGQTTDINGSDTANRALMSHEDGAASTVMSWTLSSAPTNLAQVGIGLIGTSYAYEVGWNDVVQTSVTKGGIYRRLDSVWINDLELTSRASVTLVNSNLGSYYYDSANHVLYISTSRGNSPNSFAFVGVWFTIFLSTKDPRFADQPLYEPRLTGALPQLRATKPDELYGAAIWDDGSLEIANADAMFDALSRLWGWENKRVTLRLGGSSLAFADYLTLRVMRCVSIDVDDMKATLTLKTMSEILSRNIPLNTIGSSTAAAWNIGTVSDEISAQPAPVLFGSMLDCPLRQIADNGSNLATYVVLDASGGAGPGYSATVAALYAVNNTTGARTTLDVVIDSSALTIGTYGLLGNYAYRESAGYTLRADLTRSGGTLYPGTMAYQLLLMCGEDAANIDAAAFTQADTDAPYEVGAYLIESEAAADVMQKIEQSAMLQVYVGTDGLWTCRALNPVATAVATVVDQDCATWLAKPVDQQPLSDVRVQYRYNPAAQSFREVSRTDSATQFVRETTDSVRLPTYLRTEQDAQEVCDRYAFIKERARSEIETEQATLALVAAMPGDLVTITRSRAPTRTGTYVSDTVMLREVTVTLGADVSVKVVIDDLAQAFDLVGVYSDDTGADWSTATADQKRTLCFYSDDDGFLDATDATTKNRKVYW
jgi:hypothetical protein